MIREAHPELCFGMLNGGRPMVDAKSQPKSITDSPPADPGTIQVLNGETRTVARDGSYKVRMCFLHDSSGRPIGFRYGGAAP